MLKSSSKNFLVVMLVISVMCGIYSIPNDIPEPELPTITPTPVVTSTEYPPRIVEPLSIPTPEKVPTVVPSKTSTPRPTGEEVTAEIVVRLCEYYRPLVEGWYDEFPIDPNIVLAVMAQESACNPNEMSDDGYSTIGLMQIAVKPWTLAEEYLWQPRWNIWQGMYMLNANINNEEENPEKDMHRALAAYNCGWTSLNADVCLYFGGPVYADKVLYYWLPYFE